MTRSLVLLLLAILPACSGVAIDSEAPTTNDAPLVVAPSQGPVELAFCRAVERCTDYGWIDRNATETCGAGDAFDRVMSKTAALELAGQIERDLCRAYAPPALIRFWCADLQGDEQLACIRPLCPVDALGAARCLDDA